MYILYRSAACVLLGVILFGCATFLEVKKVAGPTDDAKGTRYALPQPFLLVTPQADGGIDVETVYLPDPDNQYAIHATSFLSTYTLDVSLEKGLLKKFQLKSENDAVASQLIESSGNIATKRIEAKAAAEKEKTDAAKSVSEAHKARVDTAKTEVNKLRTDLSVAEAKLAALQAKRNEGGAAAALVSDQALFEAELAIVEVRAKLDAAERALVSIVNETGTDAMNVRGSAPSDSPKAWGPILYRVVPDKQTGGVQLVAVADQELQSQAQHNTSTLPPKPPTPKPQPRRLSEN